MTVSHRNHVGVLGLLAALSGLLSGCSSDDSPTLFTATNLTCDQDVSSDALKDTVERVGGLRTDDYTVTFAKGTRAGVIALVDGDTKQAFEDLSQYPEIGAVATVSDVKDPGTISGFAQVQQIVDDACGS